MAPTLIPLLARRRMWSPNRVLSDVLITLDIPTAIARGGLLTQDAGSATPATDDAELVYNQVCPWTGNRFRATGAATRPILRNVDGTWFVQGTGTQFFDMSPRVLTVFQPGAFVVGFRAASINGLCSTSIDGGIDGPAQATRVESGTVNLWPGSLAYAITPSGVSITDSVTAEFSSDGANNSLAVRKNGTAVGSGTEVIVAAQAGLYNPSILTGGNGTGFFLTGFVRRAIFFKAAISEATRREAERWVVQ